MRGIAYVIAAIAAVGIVIGIASIPKETAETNVQQATATSSPNVMAEAGVMTFDVPSMHCEFACYPRVKEAIENASGVQSVELAEQKEEGVIDNRQVVVKYDAGFDVNDALALLAKEGFGDSDIVQ